MSRTYKHIVFLTGAGISAESGLSTFRSENGLWNNHRVEDVATIEAYLRNPDYVHQFYNDMRPELFKAEPNPAHLAITELQNNYPAQIDVVTQNVDTLHEKAGNKNIYHIHGQINQIVCMNCGHVFETWGDITSEDKCEKCGTVGMLKPNIVFFGENLLYMNQVDTLLKSCDLFISVGTSGVVYPAAGFVQFAKMFGADTIELNMETTSNNLLFDRHIYGPAGTTLPAFVKELLDNGVTK
jgi:NAD-dependent deacetylase